MRSHTGWAVAGAAMVAPIACAAGSVASSEVTLSSGGSGGSSEIATASFAGVTVGGGTPCGMPCSADLKNVLDCDGYVVEQCAFDTACLNGTCGHDPCVAAAAMKGNHGCELWAVKPEPDPWSYYMAYDYGQCFAVFVANSWDTSARLEVLREGTPFSDTSFIRIPQGEGASITYKPYDPTVGVPPGEVAVIFLSHKPNAEEVWCPVSPALEIETGVIGTGKGRAFQLRSDRPVVAYSMWPYSDTGSHMASATLLLPAAAWDVNYLAVNPYEKSQLDHTGKLKPSLAILAGEDGTEVTLLPKAAIEGGPGVSGGPANSPVTYLLGAGEFVQLSQDVELTGSIIQASKPVGLWGGANCFHVPANTGACDSAHQQIPPIRALGSRYAGVRYRNRASATLEETPPWRLVGVVDGTTLTWTPSPPPEAPATLDQGEVAEFLASGPFVVESQGIDHPFYAAQYMTGAYHIAPPGPGDGEGDPEWVNIVPVDQYLERYVFFTDPTYPETSLVVVRRRSSTTNQFATVTLDCAGALTGWEPLGELEYTRISLVTGNFESVNGCANGRHEIASDAPFSVTVWGWGGAGSSNYSTKFVSYAYPAGASLRSINDVVVAPTPR
jgi:hypothetical protein